MGIETVISAGIGLLGAASSRSNARRANRAMDAQTAAVQGQTELGREQLAFSRERYEQWRQEWSPFLEQIRMEAMEAQRPDFDAIAADTAAAYDTSQEVVQRNRERRGLRPSEGSFARDERRYALGRAAGTVNARNQAREAAEGQRFGRMAALVGVGVGQGQQALSGVNQAYAGARSALSGAAGVYGQQAGTYGALAAEGARTFTGTDWAKIFDDTFGGRSGQTTPPIAPPGT